MKNQVSGFKQTLIRLVLCADRNRLKKYFRISFEGAVLKSCSTLNWRSSEVMTSQERFRQPRSWPQSYEPFTNLYLNTSKTPLLERGIMKQGILDIISLLEMEETDYSSIVQERTYILETYDKLRGTNYKKLFPYLCQLAKNNSTKY